jgi:signal peptidase II
MVDEHQAAQAVPATEGDADAASTSGEASARPDAESADSDAGAPSRRSRLVLVASIAAIGLVADLWTKAWAWEHLREQQAVKVVERLLHFEFGFNTGSAFGLLRSHDWARAFFIVVTVAAVAYMVRLAMTLPRRWPSGFVAVGLITGGALGNLHDRLFRTMDVFGEGVRHGVVDFIVVFYWPGQRWPAFNIADSVLVAGVLLFMIYLHRHGEAETHERTTAGAG